MMTRSRSREEKKERSSDETPVATSFFFFFFFLENVRGKPRGNETRDEIRGVGWTIRRGETSSRGVNPWSEGESMRRFMTRL